VKESVEKSTLGDLAYLAQLKEQMEGAESKAAAKKR
jgi:small subunit ribosomal protein S1